MTNDGRDLTEDKWLKCEYHSHLACFVAERMSLRKLRLVRVAMARRVEHFLVDERFRYALELSEAYADGAVTEEELFKASCQASLAFSDLSHHQAERQDEWIVALNVCCAAGVDVQMRDDIELIDVLFSRQPRPKEFISPNDPAANLAEAELARDIFGNPFRPITFDPHWRTETVTSLASSIYAERAFDRLPILADALEEAGCDHADILTHCRGPGPHARGCWVIDGVLGKE